MRSCDVMVVLHCNYCCVYYYQGMGCLTGCVVMVMCCNACYVRHPYMRVFGLVVCRCRVVMVCNCRGSRSYDVGMYVHQRCVHYAAVETLLLW